MNGVFYRNGVLQVGVGCTSWRWNNSRGRCGSSRRYLNRLLTRLDQGGGWCGVFWQRDPDGMRACLDGLEVPPWDVVEALCTTSRPRTVPPRRAQETERARALHSASLAAYDSRPGGRDALGDRLDVMLREQRYAAERTAELTRRSRPPPPRRRPTPSAWTWPGPMTTANAPPPAAQNCTPASRTSTAAPRTAPCGARRTFRGTPPGTSSGWARRKRRNARPTRRSAPAGVRTRTGTATDVPTRTGTAAGARTKTSTATDVYTTDVYTRTPMVAAVPPAFPRRPSARQPHPRGGRRVRRPA